MVHLSSLEMFFSVKIVFINLESTKIIIHHLETECWPAFWVSDRRGKSNNDKLFNQQCLRGLRSLCHHALSFFMLGFCKHIFRSKALIEKSISELEKDALSRFSE